MQDAVADRAPEGAGACRVAIVTESFLPTINGVTNSVCRIADHLLARGHEVLIIAPGPGPRRYGACRVHRMPSARLPFYRSFRVGLPLRRTLAHRLTEFRPDVVHLASPAVLGATAGAVAWTLGIPTVAVFQTDLAGFARRYRMRGVEGMVWAWLRRLHTRADLTLAPSTPVVEQLARHRIPRVRLWRRGVDVDTFHPARRSAELRAELGSRGEVLVGYVGRLAADKNVELLGALNGIPNVRLVVVGEGPAGERLRRLLPEACFLGLQRGAALAESFASLDAFVHTGSDETFCQAVQEALASGVPVVAPASGGPLDLVDHGRTGLLYSADSPVELRHTVERLVADQRLRATMASSARASVVHRTWQSTGDELVEHYAHAIRRHARPGSDPPRLRLVHAAPEDESR